MSTVKVMALANLHYARSMDEEYAKEAFAVIDDPRIEFLQPPLKKDKLSATEVEAWCRENIQGVSAIITNNWSFVPSFEILDLAGPNLKLMVTPSAGYDQFNKAELKKRGIRLANSPTGLVEATAEAAFALALWAMRDFKTSERIVTSGEWSKQPHPGLAGMLGLGLQDATVGVLGMGHIGQLLIPIMSPWRIKRFLYTASRPGKPTRRDVYGHIKNATIPIEVAQDLDHLLRESDVLFLCCGLDDSTRHIINSDTLAKMKKTATLVNVGRGGLVDSKALLKALKQETIYAAGLDVLEDEWSPKVSEHDELVQHPRCVCLPHVGSAIGRNRVEAVGAAFTNLCKGALGEPIENEVQL